MSLCTYIYLYSCRQVPTTRKQKIKPEKKNHYSSQCVLFVYVRIGIVSPTIINLFSDIAIYRSRTYLYNVYNINNNVFKKHALAHLLCYYMYNLWTHPADSFRQRNETHSLTRYHHFTAQPAKANKSKPINARARPKLLFFIRLVTNRRIKCATLLYEIDHIENWIADNFIIL